MFGDEIEYVLYSTNTCILWFSDLTEDDRVSILEYAERYISTSCYKQLFCPQMSDEEEMDLDFQKHIRSLKWVSAKDLKCPINLHLPEVPPLIMKAIKGILKLSFHCICPSCQKFYVISWKFRVCKLLCFLLRVFCISDLLKMDGKLATQDKLNCIIKCCKTIFQILKICNQSQRPISADDFFPTLIFVCLKANPARIQSNLNFVRRFSNENKIRMGEGGYLFANLVSLTLFAKPIRLYILLYEVK